VFAVPDEVDRRPRGIGPDPQDGVLVEERELVGEEVERAALRDAEPATADLPVRRGVDLPDDPRDDPRSRPVMEFRSIR